MEEKHKCKLCARRFGSGRALGGHMRSHFTILPVPPKTQPTSLIGTPSSSSEAKNPSQLEDSVVLDDESETESKSLGPSGSRRVGKRSISEWRKLGAIKKSKSKKRSTEQAVSSVSETCSEEDLAMCLMLLSRDKWVRKECPVGRRNQIFLKNGTGGGGDVKIHECPVCYKVYKSGQALGGHKRSHLFSSTSTAAAHSSDADNVWLIDLNLPAPLEDGGDMSHNQIPVLC
uniref:C2H2-type domain-containing protein n=1 Tax=Kalanchoe fedtschenkoi TaxID=63787 RepID=A0A7N0VG98_KALFE